MHSRTGRLFIVVFFACFLATSASAAPDGRNESGDWVWRRIVRIVHQLTKIIASAPLEDPVLAPPHPYPRRPPRVQYAAFPTSPARGRCMSVVLAVRDVVKTFGAVRAVDGVSFSVRRGTITGLLGRNGAGKTTTIRMITGIFLPDSGTIEWAGGGGGGDARDRIGYLPEERGPYQKKKVGELLQFLAEIKGRWGAGVVKDIDKWLERFELGEKRDAKVEELSKGNQQKVQLIGPPLRR